MEEGVAGEPSESVMEDAVAVDGKESGGEDELVEDLIEEVAREEVERDSNEPTAEGDSDPELDELLEGIYNFDAIWYHMTSRDLFTESLGEFGKHLQQQEKPAQPVTSDPSAGASGEGGDSFEEIFNEEFAVEAEAQLNEAMEMLASENPELWQQFESFAKSMGMDDVGGASQSQATPTTNGAASAGNGETSVDSGGGKERGGAANLDEQLEETLKRLRETTEQIEVRGEGGRRRVGG